MKKLALTNLLLLLAVKFVSACDYVGETPPNVFEGRVAYFWAMFILSIVLFALIVAIYFLRKRQGLWTIITSMTSFILFFPVIVITALATTCSDGSYVALVIIAEFFLMCLLFTFQLSSWISQRKIATKLR